MEIRIGDIVRFLTDKLEGKVCSIVDSGTVNVYVDEYGFEIPASVEDLVVIRSDLAAPAEEREGCPARPVQEVRTETADCLYLAVVPEDFNNLLESRYTLYLVNDTAQTCLYSVAFREGERYAGLTAGNCSPDSSVPLGEYKLREIDRKIKAVHVTAVFFQKGGCLLKSPVEAEVKLNTVSLCKSGSYSHSRWFGPLSLLRPLSREKEVEIPLEAVDGTKLMQAVREKKAAEQEIQTARQQRHPQGHPQKQAAGNFVEIDLHCSEVLDTTAGMDNGDILEYQLDVFRRTMEEYKLKKGQKIVFIHGKGDGVLRQRIIWELQTRYRRHRHQDASFKQYGYGATLVTIR